MYHVLDNNTGNDMEENILRTTSLNNVRNYVWRITKVNDLMYCYSNLVWMDDKKNGESITQKAMYANLRK